ncbi:MAG: GYF domain-containing protein [Bacteroidota bacterium]
MKKYYLHNGTESSGPFDLEELKIKQITAKTPVWSSGMPDWKNAEEIDELKFVLIITPPPFKATPPIPKREEKKTKIMGLNKSTFYLISFLAFFIIGVFVLNILEEHRSKEFEQKNSKTESENRQFQLQQKEIEEQKSRLEEQERLDAERIAKERKETINSELSKIQIKQIENQTRLEEAKNSLTKATDFQFFRTANERNEELNAIQTEINHLKDEMQQLENKRNQLSLELERMQEKHIN